MALTAAAAIAATTAAAAYLDARFLIRHDLSNGTIASGMANAIKYITEQTIANRLLNYHKLEDNANDPKLANQPFLLFEGRIWTYAQFFADLQRVAKWLIEDLGIEKQEIVAINGANSPEYLLLWFALEGIGAVPAFLNCNLSGDGLVHCVKLAAGRLHVVEDGNKHNVEGVVEELEAIGIKTQFYSRKLFEQLPGGGWSIPRERNSKLMPDELSCLLYTSGTTGLPKAIMMGRGREINTGRGVADHLKLTLEDRMYTCMPLYHGAAHGLCITPVIHGGSSVALSRKFSHKTFWPEVRQSKANIIQYVGELCRYLMNAPPSPGDKEHVVKMAWGNGMRPDVWEKFRQRFGIEIIHELYAATDGMGASFNRNRGEFGRNAIGIRGLYWTLMNGVNEKRVRIDVVTEEIVRDENGFAIKCKLGEPGEVVHKADPNLPRPAFGGYYKNEGATDKRFIRDLFEKGDYWFRSGDMMRQDPDGCIYFVDRLGDTFRWKSENVSTNEVSDVLGHFKDVAEANVYGVAIPNADGRCGCAAIVFASGLTEETFDFEGLAKHAIKQLPRYAVPIFLRLTPALQYTGTMKLQKGKLKQEGVDPDKVEGEDRIYWLPTDGQKYVPFRRKDWEAIKGAKVKL